MSKILFDQKHITVPVHLLAGVFQSTTTSYKYLFFRALLKTLEAENFSKSRISIALLATEMLSGAWYSVFYYRLSFGASDQVARCLNEIFPEDASRREEQKIMDVLKTDDARTKAKILIRYVPQRLISPWFNELQRLPDGEKNNKINELSSRHFNDRKPIYRIEKDELDFVCGVALN